MAGTRVPPQAPFEFINSCVRPRAPHLNGRRRSRKGRPPRTRGTLQAFGAGLGCLRLRGTPSADSRPYDSSAAQPAAAGVASKPASHAQIGPFFNVSWGGDWPQSDSGFCVLTLKRTALDCRDFSLACASDTQTMYWRVKRQTVEQLKRFRPIAYISMRLAPPP